MPRPGRDREPQETVGDALAEDGALHELGVGVEDVVVPRQPGERDDVRLGDGAARRQVLVAHLDVLEVLAARLRHRRPPRGDRHPPSIDPHYIMANATISPTDRSVFRRCEAVSESGGGEHGQRRRRPSRLGSAARPRVGEGARRRAPRRRRRARLPRDGRPPRPRSDGGPRQAPEVRRLGLLRHQPVRQPDERLRAVLLVLRLRQEEGRRGRVRALDRGHRRHDRGGRPRGPHRGRPPPGLAVRVLRAAGPDHPRDPPRRPDQGLHRGRDRLPLAPLEDRADRGAQPPEGRRAPHHARRRRRDLLRPAPEGAPLHGQGRGGPLARDPPDRPRPRHPLQCDDALRPHRDATPSGSGTCCASGSSRTRPEAS